jgi:threonine dehydratase
VPVHPYDDERVMAGQGTVALELLQDAGPLDVLLVCVGGGGLIAGCATAVEGLSPQTRVIGVEPEAGDDTRRSLQAGERVRVPVPRTIADGQQLPMPGERTFPVVQRLVEDVVTVSDAEIVDAMRFLFERAKTVAEPSGASAFAALLAGRVDAAGLRVGVTISGGNVTAERFAELVA